MGDIGPIHPIARPTDDRLTNLLSYHLANHPTTPFFSLEFFPPKTQAGFANLHHRLNRMVTALRPLYVTVTWGAGGSTATKSLELAEICQRQLGVPTVLHLTCTNMTRRTIDEALEACEEVGIRNILALRGDPPREEYRDSDSEGSNRAGETNEEEFVWAVDLVRYIKRKYGDHFCIGVAGYPEGHADESHPEAGKQSVEHDLPYLAEKTRAGADFIMTQLTYDADAYRKYEERLRGYEDEQGKVFERIPIIPGLMPIQSYQIIKRITKLSHAKIPEDIARRIEEVKNDDEAVKKVGVDIVSELVEKIRKLPTLPAGVPRGLHFYTLNLEKSVAYILERCRLLSPASDSESGEDSDIAVEGSSELELTGSMTNGLQDRFKRRASSTNAQPHNRVIIDSLPSKPRNGVVDVNTTQKAIPRRSGPQDPSVSRHQAQDSGSGIPATAATRTQSLLISEGHGSLGREATWDDFPNGRWGPSHSPAFGEIDGYGPSLKVGPMTARRLWGHPTSASDVVDLFRRHILGSLRAIPWSDDIGDVNCIPNNDDPNPCARTDAPLGTGPLRTETDVIRKELLHLIEHKNYLTLASQPALDGVSSADPAFGWGPSGEGFVFQKAFVEFFCLGNEWPALRQKLVNADPTEYSWLKTDAFGNFESSESRRMSYAGSGVSSKRTPGTKGVNAVTWGVFRGKEIVTPTIIEAESFRAWGEEAFSIWGEWRKCFPRGSVEEQNLERLRKSVVLVNVVSQCYVGGHDGDGGGLWRWLGA